MESPSRYVLFDLGGQNVAVTNLEVAEDGRLQMTWVVLDKVKKYSDDEIDSMLVDAFRFLFENLPEE